MKVAVASDHAGFAYKEKVRQYLSEKGYEVVDFGAFSADRSDYPDFGHPASEAVSNGSADRGVFVCGSGIGISITANRHRGVRAVDAVTTDMAKMAREHNDANVLALGERLITWEEATKIIDTFFSTPFEGGRHERRVEKIDLQ
jgi:ribose 5-phosphate isomerase B